MPVDHDIDHIPGMMRYIADEIEMGRMNTPGRVYFIIPAEGDEPMSIHGWGGNPRDPVADLEAAAVEIKRIVEDGVSSSEGPSDDT